MFIVVIYAKDELLVESLDKDIFCFIPSGVVAAWEKVSRE
jgi:hypothetical protein